MTFLKEDVEHNTKIENKNSENLLIKGDNLEVLKHLKNAYAEQIKMIYIHWFFVIKCFMESPVI